MQAQQLRHTEGPPRLMGQVFVRLTLTNRFDEEGAERGLMPRSDVRSVELDRVLVDTGATHLCLPADILRRLGVRVDRQVTMLTANGARQTNVYRDIGLRIEDRGVTVECLELDAGSQPLLGAVPMQSLGVEPDLVNHRLRLLPEDASSTWIMAL
ncbi:MAG: aspartyl protease [Anaerolinea sp.]|nr:aspartyl protease [Anaerolinea sp.]